MSNLNNTFLEEYKRLDKLCREIYQAEKGITNYIEDMKHVTSYDRLNIPNWDCDLRKLIYLRGVRNKLTHEIGTFNMDMCTQSDIEWLRTFYNRIFNQSDPMALLHKRLNTQKQIQMQEQVQFQIQNYQNIHPGYQPSGDISRWIPIIVAAAVLISTILFCLILTLLFK